MIAEWIKAARTDAGLSGAELGAKLELELGVSRGHTRANISHWETGKHEPSIQQILAIVKITGQGLPREIMEAMNPRFVGGESQSKPLPVAASAPPWMDPQAFRLLDLYYGTDPQGQAEIMSTALEARPQRISRAASNEA